MTSFIEELYYDNIKPQEKSIRKSDLCKEELSVLHENEQFLLENLPDNLKTVFIEYADTWGLVNGKTVLDGFTAGFRFGAHFAVDTFCGNKISIEEYLKEK